MTKQNPFLPETLGVIKEVTDLTDAELKKEGPGNS